jgi:hypothetical protein
MSPKGIFGEPSHTMGGLKSNFPKLACVKMIGPRVQITITQTNKTSSNKIFFLYIYIFLSINTNSKKNKMIYFIK